MKKKFFNAINLLIVLYSFTVSFLLITEGHANGVEIDGPVIYPAISIDKDIGYYYTSPHVFSDYLDPADIGEDIWYFFLVRNTGNVALSSVTVFDEELKGSSDPIFTIGTLQPEGEAIWTSTLYTTKIGYHENIATVTALWFDSEGSHLVTADDSAYYNAVSAAVPEPSAILLLGFGLVGLAGVARKKMRS